MSDSAAARKKCNDVYHALDFNTKKVHFSSRFIGRFPGCACAMA
jgi:hypothetical protein